MDEMHVIKVIPISRRGLKGHLSFFSKKDIPEGAVIDVPVRGKPTPALVIASVDARDEKLLLRGSSFSLKKIAPKSIRTIFPAHIIAAFRKTAEWHAVGLGEVLAHFSPKAVLTAPVKTPVEEVDLTDAHAPASETLVLQANLDERMRMYRSLAREAFARNESLMIITPTIAETEILYEKLHRGIEESVIILTSALTKKKLITTWERAINSTQPVLIIATYSFVALPRNDFNAIIIEHENARSYTAREHPRIDTRVAAEYIAQASNTRIIFADFPVRVETRARLESGELEELTRLQVSSQSTGQIQIIDAKEKKNIPADVEAVKKEMRRRKQFSVFTDAAREAITQELARGGRVFLYATRRGLAPVTVCNDCGTPVTDPATGSPMTLHKTNEGNVFLSFYSGAIMPSNISCRDCGSWNLVSLGIGVQRVIEEVEKLFENAPLFSLTADTAPTHAKAKKIQSYFFNTPGAILVGTERALPYLNEPTELSVVTSIDSLLSISAWRAHEYALATLFYISDRTQDRLLIQTRLPDHPVMHAMVNGNPTDFIRTELAERKKFGYPPFSLFIGLTWTGTEKTVTTIGEELKEPLAQWDVVGPLPPRAIKKNQYLARAVIRVPKDSWPHPELVRIIKNLPRTITVTVNPDDII
ncbi:MAG: hypothetical protein ACJKTH_03150 [Patescibacteria group bacterium UBA2163]